MSSETNKPSTYIRRRAFNKVHVTSWLIYLEKDGFVRCPFKNCNFMAFDVEEMCDHYGFCQGESVSDAEFVCDICDGRTVSLKKLQLHKSRAHNLISPKETDLDLETETSTCDSGKPSRVLVLSWGCFYDKHKYIKCANCNYLANSLNEMTYHYGVCKKDCYALLYVCPECKGRTYDVSPLILHLEISHNIKKSPNHFNQISVSKKSHWEKEISETTFASCLHNHNGERDCFYFDTDLWGIIEHSQTCKMPQSKASLRKEECPNCNFWTDSKEKILQHIDFLHIKDENKSNQNKVRSGLFVYTPSRQQKRVRIVPCNNSRKSSTDFELIISSETNSESNIITPSISNKKRANLELLQYQETTASNELSLNIKNEISCSEEEFNNIKISNHSDNLVENSIIEHSVNNVDKDIERTEQQIQSTSQTSDYKSMEDEMEESLMVIDLERGMLEQVKNQTNVLVSNEHLFKMHVDCCKQENLSITTNKQCKEKLAPVKMYTTSAIDSGVNSVQSTSKYDLDVGTRMLTSQSKDKKLHMQEKSSEVVNPVFKKKDHNPIKEPSIENTKGKLFKKSCYTLFDDDSTSEEEDIEEIFKQSKSQGDSNASRAVLLEQSKTTFEKNAPKNYLKKSSSSKSESSSSVKVSRTSEDSFKETNICLKDSDHTKKTNFISERSKQFENRMILNKNVESKTELFENEKTSGNGFPEEISKNSEKNDKLLLKSSEKLGQMTVCLSVESMPSEAKTYAKKINCNKVISNVPDIKTRIKPESNESSEKNSPKINDINKISVKKDSARTVVLSLPVNSSKLKIDQRNKPSTAQENPCYSIEQSIPNSSQINAKPKTIEPDIKIPQCSLSFQDKRIISSTRNESRENASDLNNKIHKIKTGIHNCNENKEVDQNEIVKPIESRVVSFFYQGKLNKCSLESNSTTVKNVTGDKRQSELLKGHNNLNICDKSIEIVENDSYLENTADVSRRLSSESCIERSSGTEEECFGTDEEVDMKDQFNGFQEISERSHSRNRRFQQFVNRLSESENEEWYVNAGNLSMDFRKAPKFYQQKHQEESDSSLHLFKKITKECDVLSESISVKHNKISSLLDETIKTINSRKSNDIKSLDKITDKNSLPFSHRSKVILLENDISKITDSINEKGHIDSLDKANTKKGKEDKTEDSFSGSVSRGDLSKNIHLKNSANIKCERPPQKLKVGTKCEKLNEGFNGTKEKYVDAVPVKSFVKRENCKSKENGLNKTVHLCRTAENKHLSFSSNTKGSHTILLDDNSCILNLPSNANKSTLGEKNFNSLSESRVLSNFESSSAMKDLKNFSKYVCSNVKSTTNNDCESKTNNTVNNDSSSSIKETTTRNISNVICSTPKSANNIEDSGSETSSPDNLHLSCYKVNSKSTLSLSKSLHSLNNEHSVCSDDETLSNIIAKNKTEKQLDTNILEKSNVSSGIQIKDIINSNHSVTPKKRGRKPKLKSEEIQNTKNDLFCEVNPNHDKTLLTPKEEDNVGDVNKREPPKKRGRKPKSKLEPVENLKKTRNIENEVSDNYSCVVPKNKCGQSGTSFTKDETQIPGIGSSSKSPDFLIFNELTSQNESGLNLNITNTERRKRGRPPKNKSLNKEIIPKDSINLRRNPCRGNRSINSKLIQSETLPLNEKEIQFSVFSEEANSILSTGILKVPRYNEEELQTAYDKSDKLDKNNITHWIDNTKNKFIHSEIPLNSSTETKLPSYSVKGLKRRGRPPKLKYIETFSVDDSFDNINLSDRSFVEPKKKRGRPPKLKPNDVKFEQEIETQEEADGSKLSHCTSTDDRNNDDVGLSNSFDDQLLGTDIILINKQKLSEVYSDTVGSGKRKRGRKPKISKTGDTVSIKSSLKIKGKRINFGDSDSDEENKKSYYQHNEKSRDEDYDINKDSAKNKTSWRHTYPHKPAEDAFFKAKHKTSDKVICGVCDKSMTFQNYKVHHSVFKHYMLCWLKDEEPPVDMNDDKDIVNRLWFAKKRLGKTPYRCFNCNLPKLSAVGFQSHIKFCGKEDQEKQSLLVTCEVCGVRMMPSSIRPHMYMKHTATSIRPPNEPTLDKSVIIPKTKRAAAAKAVEGIQQSQTNETEQEEPRSRPHSPNSKLHLLSQFYSKPSNMIQPKEYSRWKTSLTETNVVKCEHPGCSFTADSTAHFRKHYLTCSFAPPRVFRCKQCVFITTSEEQIEKHLIEKHEDLINNQSSDKDSSEDSDGEQRSTKNVRLTSTSLPLKFLRSVMYAKVRGHPRKFFFREAMSWTHKLRQTILEHKSELFGVAQPNFSAWTPLLPDQAALHMPETCASVKFHMSDQSWHKLRCFQGNLFDGVPVIFTGGPVWALAWAPVPDKETEQFLAVATHPKMDQSHNMSSVYNYNSLIQIWSFGALSNRDHHSGQTPKFLMGLAHSRGAVWGLQWCPSGCFSNTRLGLLAAACSDGTVAIYAVPRYRHAFESVIEYTIYNVQPVIELKLGCEMMAQCTCIDWHSVAPHSTIAAGFANGMVALWDLNTTSPLLREGTTLFPYKVIEAHFSSVSAVHLSPTLEGTVMMTASLDRATKFWRLDDTTVPVNSLRKASVVDAVMPSHWLISINAYDDVYSMNSSHITGYNYRETFTVSNPNFVLQPGTVWGLSFSDWLNACACASEMGKVTVFFRQQLIVSEDSKKIKKDSLIGDVVTCSVKPLHSKTAEDGFGKNYNDCVSNVGLEIIFRENVIESAKPKSACSSDTMDSYPIMSINKVAWNTNFNSFTWLAAGLQCGLVMVPQVKTIPHNDLNDLYKRKDDR